ncbi:Signal transduction histidine kinase [Roseateles sp. YR242]|uniref:sensor histidine kinase n=1 Tax=Roseateles sp. YR242 TaxID=1855305 RepID=UPI0008B64A45|nr:ATP-binding protein [Roseateles sp. YR242]SEL79793.1 Signal transduction histidine kinase [Roseateles sp. YR242]
MPTPTALAHAHAIDWVIGGLNAVVLAVALVLGLLIWQRRAQRHIAWLAALMPGWVLLVGVLPHTPWPTALAIVLAPWLVWIALQYLMRRVRRRDRRLRRALLLQAVLLPWTLLLPIPHAQLATGVTWWLGLQLLAGMGWHLWHLWQDMFLPTVEERYQRTDFYLNCGLMGLGGLAVLAAGLLPGRGIPSVLVPLALTGLGLHRIREFSRALTQAELQVLQGELRLQERIAELERHFDQVAEAKLEQVTERERKRIAADLHDDLGAKLLTIVHTSESDRISTLAREALEEMRLSVRGLTGKPVQLLDALGDWRAEVVSRLAQANILAEWKSPAEDIEHTFPARAYVQTTRILREAVSNIIKHSGATHCVVGCSAQDGYFSVVIQDNGQGIPLELEGRLDKGHGMASMKSRAKQMHGQCLVESGPGWGTVIRLTIPL